MLLKILTTELQKLLPRDDVYYNNTGVAEWICCIDGNQHNTFCLLGLENNNLCIKDSHHSYAAILSLYDPNEFDIDNIVNIIIGLKCQNIQYNQYHHGFRRKSFWDLFR